MFSMNNSKSQSGVSTAQRRGRIEACPPFGSTPESYSVSTAQRRGRIEGPKPRDLSATYCNVSPRLNAVAELKAKIAKGFQIQESCVSTAQRRGRIEGRDQRLHDPLSSFVSPRLNAVAELKAATPAADAPPTVACLHGSTPWPN